MRLSLRYAFGVSNVSTFIKPPFARYVCASVKSHSPPQLTTSPMKLQAPLFLRPLTHTTTMAELRKWNEWAKSLASSMGTSFVDLDDGPDSTLLCRELKWLIEDAVEHPSGDKTSVRMRASLDELYELWKQRIEERRPFQYIVGCEHWRDLVLFVQEGVLIPRPETETIVELVSGVVSGDEELRDGLWVDLGTGSGAIAIGIGMVLKSKGRVIATDLSPLALSVASFNLQRYDLQDVIELRQGCWFEPLKDLEGKVSGIVSNPPYIPSEYMSGLQAEVGRHEPTIALHGGVDGMDHLLLLCKGASSVLKPGGFIAFETNGEKQCKQLIEYMETDTGDCFRDVKIVSDFAGVPRFVTGFRK